ncbi:MAG: 16S rRNA (cytidine(1402)-2'-O)-methyltransferase [Chloroflexi bacterium]|nr:16S rRNA (cytidine(1402)-2'-O)-methyltransferase [Chloroflexota bacterium]
MPGTLYVVTTPIGNLEDLTLRAVRVLGEVGLVAAEDTRQTRKLLTHLGLSKKRVVSYNEHNAAQRSPRLLHSLLTEDVALVTDAGVPAVSDPGADLVRLAAEQGNVVVPIPGPSAVTAALSVAGISGAFRFLGFPARARKGRKALFSEVEHEQSTLVLFEAPHRVRAMLEDVATVLGERPLVVCRELTKLHEELFRGTAAEALAHFEVPRGEFAIVIQGAQQRAKAEIDEAGVLDALTSLKAQGQSRRDSVAQVTDAYGISKREAYKLWLAI